MNQLMPAPTRQAQEHLSYVINHPETHGPIAMCLAVLGTYDCWVRRDLDELVRLALLERAERMAATGNASGDVSLVA